MNKRFLIMSLNTIALAFVLGFWAGCSVDFNAEQDDIYACTTEADCIPGYQCTQNTCTKPTIIDSGGEPCVDADGDGYGAEGTVTTNCPGAFQGDPNRTKPDCDDTNPNVNPGAQEVCDGIDNNCDGNIDVVPCTSDGDCPFQVSDPQENDVNYRCVDNFCVAFPVNAIGAVCRQPLECRNGVLDTVPAECL